MELTENHKKNLPIIRLAAITLDNYRSVKHGEIIFECGRRFVPYGTESDILGIYGQNGAGKSSVIEAISILKYALSGDSILEFYSDCIDVESDHASLSFVFDFQYPKSDSNNSYPTNGDIRKVEYSFNIAKMKIEERNNALQLFKLNELNQLLVPNIDSRLRIYDEKIKVSGTICGEKKKTFTIIDTCNQKLSPSNRIDELLGTLDENKRVEIGINKRDASSNSKSFVFMDEMMGLFQKYSGYSIVFQILMELQNYGKTCLYVADNKVMNSMASNFILPIFTYESSIPFFPISLSNKTPIPKEAFEDFKNYFDELSIVLSEIIPGMSIIVKDMGPALTDDGEEGVRIELVSKRNNVEIPLRCESDGIRKLIATLQMLIDAFNREDVTVAYDEFDSGIFEYLLGEILRIIQSDGLGQFIFTSHNMRPLEILKKEFVRFTTNDPYNRYVKISGLGETNNLRKVYYREIAMHEHYDNLYTDTNRSKIISALRKAKS